MDSKSNKTFNHTLNGFDAWLLEFLTVNTELESLRRSITYAVFPSGKRLRPLLLFACLSDLGLEQEPYWPVAGCLELLHCSSLVHDDLPALDNDQMRRGKPTLHRAFGEANAILAGDALIGLAFHALAETRPKTAVANSAHSAKLAVVAASAFTRLCEGQLMDLEGARTIEGLDQLQRAKTGALFRAIFQCAAIASGQDLQRYQAFGHFGEELGLYFQIVDDFLDVFGTDAERGRTGSSDNRNQKFTRFTNMAAKAPIQEARAYLQKAQERIGNLLSALKVPNSKFEAVSQVIDQISQRWLQCGGQ
jgi:geranylgeranyl diphosphate synthase type II